MLKINNMKHCIPKNTSRTSHWWAWILCLRVNLPMSTLPESEFWSHSPVFRATLPAEPTYTHRNQTTAPSLFPYLCCHRSSPSILSRSLPAGRCRKPPRFNSVKLINYWIIVAVDLTQKLSTHWLLLTGLPPQGLPSSSHPTSQIPVQCSVASGDFLAPHPASQTSDKEHTGIFLTMHLLNVLLWLPMFYLLSWSICFFGEFFPVEMKNN